MEVEEIAALPVREVAAEDSHLYLWVTNNYLRRAFEVVDAWGFRYVTAITWLKEGRPGLGQYFRGITEHALFCVRGSPGYRLQLDGRRAQGLTGFTAPRPGAHSRKPNQIHHWAELVSPGPYLEMFARAGRDGWTAWGDEAPEPTTLEDFLS